MVPQNSSALSICRAGFKSENASWFWTYGEKCLGFDTLMGTVDRYTFLQEKSLWRPESTILKPYDDKRRSLSFSGRSLQLSPHADKRCFLPALRSRNILLSCLPWAKHLSKCYTAPPKLKAGCFSLNCLDNELELLACCNLELRRITRAINRSVPRVTTFFFFLGVWLPMNAP